MIETNRLLKECGAYLRQLRENEKVTISQMAKEMSVERQRIVYYEKQDNLGVKFVRRYLEALKNLSK